MGIEGSLVFCDCALYGDRSVDVADMDEFVIAEILPIALVRPAIHEFLPGDLIQVLIRIVHNEGQLDVFLHVATFLDLRVSVLHHSRLGMEPERVDKMCRISFNIEVMLLPELV